MSKPQTHPIQLSCCHRDGARVPMAVTMQAYEVYSHVYGPQVAMITGDCRGGFSAGELVAFLYARAFPKMEWRERVDEALIGMSFRGTR